MPREKEHGFQAGYTLEDVTKILGVSRKQIRRFVQSGFLAPRKGRRGEFRFGLPDLVLLRTANELSARIPSQRLKRALKKLRESMPEGRPLTGVRITAVGEEVVIRDGRSRWKVDSGQGLLDFDVAEITAQVAPITRRAAAAARIDESKLSADDWYAMGFDFETCDTERARDAYRRALELEPDHQSSRVNLGRLLQEAGHTAAAIAHYRMVLGDHPEDATAAFNLGVALEDIHEDAEAATAYELAVQADPAYADAYYNLARVYERTGKAADAFQLLKTYRSLIQQ